MDLTIPVADAACLGVLYGNSDRNLRLIRAAFGVHISARGGKIRISGRTEDVHKAAQVVETLQRHLKEKPDLPDELIQDAIDNARLDGRKPTGDSLAVFLPSACIAPKTEGQHRYIEGIRGCDLTFCLGPAGTGKTYLAVAVAVALLKETKIKRIVLVRPAVEAGEKLGYLPGDLQAKVNPYLRPLFDAMNDMMTFDQIKRFMLNDVIEVIPLAFMRGRTLNNSVIILDEAQNATSSQMLMFLTRLGHGSKMIVTGDDSQSDLSRTELSGLADAIGRLADVTGVSIVKLDNDDIVRHQLVQQVVAAYGRNNGAVL